MNSRSAQIGTGTGTQPPADVDAAQHLPWRDLVADIGADIAGPLSDALERIHEMSSSGRIDGQGLLALRIAVEEARQVGMTAQLLVRFASRRVRLSHEHLPLTAMLRDVLQHRGRDAGAHGLPLHQASTMQHAEVLADASMLFSLLHDRGLGAAPCTRRYRLQHRTQDLACPRPTGLQLRLPRRRREG